MATPRRNRLVRQQPLSQRILSYLNPADNLLALSSAIEAYDLDALGESFATPLGLVLNVIMLVARSNANTNINLLGRRKPSGGVLLRPGESLSDPSPGGIGYFMALVAWILALISVVNFIHCFTRKRSYRLFEADVQTVPSTPSARRVNVNSSPSESSPFRILNNFIQPVLTPFSSSQPDLSNDGITENEVWEVSVWDPTPLSLRLFALFSPAHVAVYFLSLPTSNTTTSQSNNKFATLFIILVTIICISTQTIFLTQKFTTQRLDSSYIQREVMKEYDQKFVNPRLNVLKRDVSTTTESGGSVEASPSLGNSFKVAPNPAYFRHTLQRTGAMKATEVPLRPVEQPVFGSVGRASLVKRNSGLRGGYANQVDIGSQNGSESPRRGRSASPKKRVQNIFGGDVDYGVPSPVKRFHRDRGV